LHLSRKANLARVEASTPRVESVIGSIPRSHLSGTQFISITRARQDVFEKIANQMKKLYSPTARRRRRSLYALLQ
jgi:hypothetical protein